MLALGVAVSVLFAYYKEDSERSFVDRFEDAMWACPLKTYHDSVYDYEVYYPSFFEQLPPSLVDEPGCSLFRYWDNWVQVELVTQVLPEDAVQHADTFVAGGPLLIDGSEIPGYRYHAKYVKHRRLWFVQTLTYPERCEKAVRRLIRQVDNWTVWQEL